MRLSTQRPIDVSVGVIFNLGARGAFMTTPTAFEERVSTRAIVTFRDIGNATEHRAKALVREVGRR